MIPTPLPVATAEVTFAADLPTVWAAVTDLELMGRYSPEFEGGEWLDPPRLGARFRGRNRRGDRGWETVSTVVEYDAPHVFAWAVNDIDDPAATWRLELTVADGHTAVTQTAILGPGPSGLRRAIDRYPDRVDEIVRNRIEEVAANMQATLEGIRSQLEG